MHEDHRTRVPQEIAFTTEGLIRVAAFALVAFATLTWLLDAPFRSAAFVIGVTVIGAIALLLLHLHRQRRYGTATLIAEGRFELGRAFAGTVATALARAPESPIRITIAGRSSRSEVTLARTTVDPMHLRRDSKGSLLIPFRVPPPADAVAWKPREVRLRVRTARWPLGWGATFLIDTIS